MKKFIFFIAAYLILPIGVTYAGCGATHIIINNATQTLCTLKEYQLKHGYLDYVSIVPAYILPNAVAHTTILYPSFFGSELELNYLCGNQQVTLTTKSKYHLFIAGKIESKSIGSDRINVESFTMHGNCLWGEHGSIQWLLKNKNSLGSVL